MCLPTSKSPRVSLISYETKIRFVLMQRVGEMICRAQRIERGFLASGEDQFLGVGMAHLLPAPGLRTWWTACPTASVWHGQPFTNEYASHIFAVNKQRA